MTKVVHMISSLDMGGAERMLSRLVTRSHRPDMEHVVICLKDRGIFGDDIEACGAQLHTLQRSSSVTALAAIPRIAQLLQAEKADVFMTWLYHADFLGTPARYLTQVPRHYWNLRCSDMGFSEYADATGWIAKILAKLAHLPDGVVVNSNAGRKVHEDLGYRPRAWIGIPNGYDLEEFHPSLAARNKTRISLGIPDDAFVIGNIARVNPMKDHATLIDVLMTVARSHDGVHFLLAGANVDSGTPLFTKAIAAPEMAGRFHLLGVRRDVPDLLAAMDLYVQSSAFGEGFPNVVAEAMASAIPSVVTNVGDAALIVDDSDRVVAPRNAPQLAAAIESFMSLPLQIRTATGQRDRDKIASEYALDKIVSKYDVLFEGSADRLQ